MSKIQILIADDHEVMRAGVCTLIEQEPTWQVCGQAENGREAVDLAAALRPNVVVLDMCMPELSGEEAVREIKRVAPESEVLIFSALCSDELVDKVFHAGARSYIQKSEAGEHLVSAIHSLAEHKPFLTPVISEIMLRNYMRPAGPDSRGLTLRESQILRLLAQGESNKEVAKKLSISVRTAETHRAALMAKLKLESVADLVRYAIRNGFIET
ncbi:MAG: response regulator transcription factor [Chthoniobacterales bacterium]